MANPYFCAIQLLGWQRFPELTRFFHYLSFQSPGLLLTSLYTWQLWPFLLNQLTLILGQGWAVSLRGWLWYSGSEVQFHLASVWSCSSWSSRTHFLTGSHSFALIATLLPVSPAMLGAGLHLGFLNWFSFSSLTSWTLFIHFLWNNITDYFLCSSPLQWPVIWVSSVHLSGQGHYTSSQSSPIKALTHWLLLLPEPFFHRATAQSS